MTSRARADSRAVKEHLKRVGADAETIRRTMIATHEAEMNVVIHAYRGRLDAWLTDTSVAIDVIDEGPGILEHLCIDCAVCIRACGQGTLTLRNEMDSVDGVPERSDPVLAVPPALLAGCGPPHSPRDVLGALDLLGFREVVTTAPYESAVRASVLEIASGPLPCDDMPAISPACPAVVNLVELKFPSLLLRLAPFASPWEKIARKPGGAEAVRRLPRRTAGRDFAPAVAHNVQREGARVGAAPPGDRAAAGRVDGPPPGGAEGAARRRC